MSVSLARRIRRIGYLPKLTLEEVLDAHQITKLKNAETKPEIRAEIENSIQQALSNHPRALTLTPEEIAQQTTVLRGLAKARRLKALGKKAKA